MCGRKLTATTEERYLSRWSTKMKGKYDFRFRNYHTRIKMKYKSFILLLAAVMVLSLSACGKLPTPDKSASSVSAGTQVEPSNEGDAPADENPAADADTSANDEAWKTEFEKSLLENYGVTPDHYEDLGDGVYQVYVEIDGKVVPYVAVDSATGDYHG